MTEIMIAKQHDAEIIALLARVTFTETFGHLFSDKSDLQSYFSKTFSVGKIRNGLKKSNNIFWIAKVDELPVGYAKLKLNSGSEFIVSDNVCQLQKIYILRDFISKKVGVQLQHELLQKAGEAGFDKIWLSVFKDNERAIRFYTKNKFHKIGHHDFKIGKEQFEFIAMSKSL